MVNLPDMRRRFLLAEYLLFQLILFLMTFSSEHLNTSHKIFQTAKQDILKHKFLQVNFFKMSIRKEEAISVTNIKSVIFAD